MRENASGFWAKRLGLFSAGSECLPPAEFCYSGHAGPAGGKHRTGREGKKKMRLSQNKLEMASVVSFQIEVIWISLKR